MYIHPAEESVVNILISGGITSTGIPLILNRLRLHFIRYYTLPPYPEDSYDQENEMMRAVRASPELMGKYHRFLASAPLNYRVDPGVSVAYNIRMMFRGFEETETDQIRRDVEMFAANHHVTTSLWPPERRDIPDRNRAHDLNLRYKDSFAINLPTNVVVHINSFRDTTAGATQVCFNTDVGRVSNFVDYVPSNLKFIPPTSIGWILESSSFRYYRQVVGAYSRSPTRNTHKLVLSVYPDDPSCGVFEESGSLGIDSVRALLNRQLFNGTLHELGKSGGQILAPHILCARLTKRDSRKHFLLYTDKCIGELHKSHKYLVLYPKYKHLIPHLSKEIPYELR